MMKWKGGIVGRNNSIRYFGWRQNWECWQNFIRNFLFEFIKKKRSDSWTSSSSQRVDYLYHLYIVTTLSFFSNWIKDRVNYLKSLSMKPFSPIISSTWCTKDKVVRIEESSNRISSGNINGSWLEISKDRSCRVCSFSQLIEIDIDPFKIKIREAMISTIVGNSVFFRYGVPELISNVVSTLTKLQVNDLSH